MQKIGQVNAVDFLTSGQGHDEIGLCYFEEDQEKTTEVKEFFHRINLEILLTIQTSKTLHLKSIGKPNGYEFFRGIIAKANAS